MNFKFVFKEIFNVQDFPMQKEEQKKRVTNYGVKCFFFDEKI